MNLEFSGYLRVSRDPSDSLENKAFGDPGTPEGLARDLQGPPGTLRDLQGAPRDRPGTFQGIPGTPRDLQGTLPGSLACRTGCL